MFSIFLAAGVSVQLQFDGLGLLLVALGGRSFGFLIGCLLRRRSGVIEPLCAFDSLLDIERTRLAIGTRVGKVLSERLLPAVWVEALDVLPRVAGFAVYRVSIIIREVADALDRVRLFLCRLNLSRRLGLGDGSDRSDWCLTRNRDLRRQRLRIFGHTLRNGLSWGIGDGQSGRDVYRSNLESMTPP
jgi:hypothetical protein